MKPAVLLVLFLISSCVYMPAEVEVKREAPPAYYPPVKGEKIRMGRGVFIRTRCGAFFRSVGEGKVIYAGRDVGNFGWVVMVRQTDGFVAVYGKTGKPWVRTGERVKARQVLGRVGKGRKGCGIYFELRNRRGDPVNPVLR
ncbi:MAG: M23 family metallopeptidase [Aquificota bacterium]|nr:M23 family metallopeptidase [Aquificota bacterium]